MSSNRKFRFGPAALTNAAANVLNPGTTTGGVNSTASPYDKLRITLKKIRAVNKTAIPATFTLYVGATGGSAAGTEIVYQKAVPASDWVDVYFDGLTLDTTDFLTGLASANTTITIEGEGEIGLA